MSSQGYGCSPFKKIRELGSNRLRAEARCDTNDTNLHANDTNKDSAHKQFEPALNEVI